MFKVVHAKSIPFDLEMKKGALESLSYNNESVVDISGLYLCISIFV